MNRRSFIVDLLRIGLAGGLVFIGAALGMRRGKETDAVCRVDLPCDGCSIWQTCRLPRANHARRESEAPNGGTASHAENR